jgi:hypothetical protein
MRNLCCTDAAAREDHARLDRQIPLELRRECRVEAAQDVPGPNWQRQDRIVGREAERQPQISLRLQQEWRIAFVQGRDRHRDVEFRR